MQEWHKGPWPKTASTTQKGIQQDPQVDPRAGDRETSNWDFQRVADHQELDLVEGLISSEAEKEVVHGDVGVPATPGIMSPTDE
jgi:hypothetical protein